MKKSVPVIISVLLVAVLLIVGGCTTTATITSTITTTPTTTTTATTTAPAGSPTVSVTSPHPNATDAHVNDMLSVTFSEAMDPSTINTQTFSLWQGTTAIAGHVHLYGGNVAIFHPNSTLSIQQAYTARITTGAKDLTGVALAANFEWIFVTSAVDTVAPIVVGTIPSLVATPNEPSSSNASFAINNKIVAIFADEIDPETVNTNTFILMRGTTPVAGTVYMDGIHSASFDPTENLVTNTVYTAKITTGVTDTAGINLATDYSWSFTTGPAQTHTPTVISTIPSGGGSVPSDNAIVAIFSEPMDLSTINNANFTLWKGTTAIPGIVDFDGVNRAFFTPTSSLEVGVTYTARISTAVKDLAGISMTAAYSWNFTVAAEQTHVPTVVFMSPADGATNVNIYTVIDITFSEEIDATEFSFSFGIPSDIRWDSTLKKVTIIPATGLAPNSVYTVTVSFQDLGGLGENSDSSSASWSFTTAP